MFANIKKFFWVLLLVFFSQTVSAATTNDIVDGFTEFLIERANANLVAVIERRLKDDENFQCFFPNTYEKVNSIKLENLFVSKNYWENSLEDDLQALIYRSILREIQLAVESLDRFKNINKIIEVMQYFEYQYHGQRYSVTFIQKDWPDELKSQVNGFSNAIGELAGLKINKKLIFKNVCQLEVGSRESLKKSLASYFKVANELRTWLKHLKKYGKNLKITEKGIKKLVCKPKNLSEQECARIDSEKPALLGILLKEKDIAKVFKAIAIGERVRKAYNDFDKLDSRQKTALVSVGLSLPLLKNRLFPDRDIKEILAKLDKIKSAGMDEKKTIVAIMAEIKGKTDKKDEDRARILLELRKFIDSKKSYTERSLIGLDLLKESGKFNTSSYARLQKSVMFFSSIADADSKDAVKNILTAYTLPAVSFSEKRKQGSGVFISSYLGFAASDFDNYSSAERASRSGLFAPVGFEYNYGLAGGGSWSVMLSPVDMAYPINLKLNGIKDKVDLDEIIAPSLTFAYGFENYPLNLGIGYQRGRTLGDIGKAEDTFLLFISFDMPLFRLY